VHLFPVAKSVASSVNKQTTGFSGIQKFESDFRSLDKPYTVPSTTSVTDSQSATDESIDRPQSDGDQLQSESTSDAEESDVAQEKLSRRRTAKLKNNVVPSAGTGREW